jgi:hypothetical protein
MLRDISTLVGTRVYDTVYTTSDTRTLRTLYREGFSIALTYDFIKGKLSRRRLKADIVRAIYYGISLR